MKHSKSAAPRVFAFHKKFRKVAFAILLATTLGAQAAPLTPAEQLIATHLPSGKTLTTASADEILTATQGAISDPQTKVLTSAIVVAGEKYAPGKTHLIARAGLDKVGLNSVSASGPALRLKQSEVAKISAISIVTAGTKYRQVYLYTPADRAAAVTAEIVQSVKPTTVNSTFLPIAVRSAMGAAMKFGTGSASSPAGVAAGAISRVAGDRNGDLRDNDANDQLVVKVLTAAIEAAGKRLLEVTEAAAYAFGGTYRTTLLQADSNATIDANDFMEKNEAKLLEAIIAGRQMVATKLGLRGVAATKFAHNLDQSLKDRITAGIALALLGIHTNGANGISPIPNPQGPPVTDISGL